MYSSSTVPVALPYWASKILQVLAMENHERPKRTSLARRCQNGAPSASFRSQWLSQSSFHDSWKLITTAPHRISTILERAEKTCHVCILQCFILEPASTLWYSGEKPSGIHVGTLEWFSKLVKQSVLLLDTVNCQMFNEYKLYKGKSSQIPAIFVNLSVMSSWHGETFHQKNRL